MKKLIFAGFIGICTLGMTSCMTINSGAAISSNSPIGTKMGEAKSTVILGLWSSKGDSNNLQQAAKNGGIKKVSHVEYIDKSYLLGLWTKHTTRVYGE